MIRPEAQSRRFASELAASMQDEVEVILSPLTRLELLDRVPDLDGIAELIFTSETGVAAFCRVSSRRDLPVWAVGPGTAAAARREGFAVRTGPGDAEGLAQLLLNDRPAGPLLYVRGKETAFPLAQTLSAGGVPTRDVVLYDQPFISPAPGATAALAGERPVVVPLFSARSASAFSGLARVATAPLYLAAISRAVVAALDDPRAARIVVAAKPDGRSMLAAVAELLRDTQQG